MKKIFILHGWTYSLDKWDKFSDLLKKEGFDLIFLKVPGLTSDSEKVWDVEKYAKWLEKEILGEDKVILLGHSNGGRIAAYFTSQYPGKIQKLILIDSAGIYHKELTLQIKRFVFGTAARIGKKVTSSETLKKFLYKLAGEKDYQTATPNMKKSMLNLINFDLAPFLHAIEVPTLIIWGSDDKLTPISDAKLINKSIINSKLRIIEGAKHSPFYTHPNEVVNILKNDI